LKTTDNQPTITTCNSQATFDQIKSTVTTIVDDQSSSLIMMPVPTVTGEQEQQLLSPSNRLTDVKADFDIFIDQQLQATLEKRLRSHSLPSTTMIHENIQQRKPRLATLTKSETGKLIDEFDFGKQVCNLEHYEKQVSRNHD